METLLRRSQLKNLGINGKYAILIFGDGFFRMRIYVKNKNTLSAIPLSVLKKILKNNYMGK